MKMRSEFFTSAFAAAKQSPEAFTAEFEKKEANVNIKKYFYSDSMQGFGDLLIHRLIEKMPDPKLPPLLNILIEKGVDLESRDRSDRTPLALSASYGQKETVIFLLNQKVNVNDKIQPPLCNVRYSDKKEILDIIEALLQRGADINIQSKSTYSPLMYAIKNTSPAIIEYLLSHGANLFLKHTCAPRKDQQQTAIGIAYQEYISTKEIWGDNYPRTQNTKKCLDLLLQALAIYLQALAIYLYQHGIKKSNPELFIGNAIDDLAGNCVFPFCKEANSENVKKLLDSQVKPAVLIQIKASFIFCMGSKLNRDQQNQNSLPSTYRFFQNDAPKYLTRKIFSYVHPVIKK